MRPSINILWQEGAGRDEKHLIFQSGALTQINAFFPPFTLRDISPPPHASSLCCSLVFVEVLVSSALPSPPPRLPTPTLLSSTLITQLLLGNVVPAGPSISHVATATERTHADTVNMLVFWKPALHAHGEKKTKTHMCIQCCNIHQRRSARINQSGNYCQFNLMHLQHLYICVHVQHDGMDL